MKKYIFLLILVMGSLSILWAQPNCSNSNCTFTGELIISTGYQPPFALVLPNPIGMGVTTTTIDPLWRLANLPLLAGTNISGSGYTAPGYTSPTNIQVGQSWVINPFQTNWNVIGAAAIISPRNNPAFTFNNAFNLLPNSQPFRIVREFCVCKPVEVELDLNLRGDDAAQITIYDPSGSSIYQFATSSPFPNNFSSTTDFDTDHPDNAILYLPSAGTYTIELQVLNNNQAAMGVSMAGRIVTTNNEQVLAHPSPCCQAGTIMAQKIIDSNCDGIYDIQADTSHQNVTFTLQHTTSGNSYTAVTNALGEVFFMNLPFGTYTLQEVVPAPYTSLTGPQTLTIGPGNQSIFAIFFNCPPPMPDCCGDTLDIYNVPGTPNPLDTVQILSQNVVVASEVFRINQSGSIPIVDLRVKMTDIDFNYNYDECARCINNPALWGSLSSPDNTVGNGPNNLTLTTPSYQSGGSSPIPDLATWREIIWENPNGAMLTAGNTFTVSYLLPPSSAIPCCVTSVKVCIEISYKDGNCNVCTLQTCSNIQI